MLWSPSIVRSVSFTLAAVLSSLAIGGCKSSRRVLLTSPAGAPILLFNGTGTSPNDVAALEVVLNNNALAYATIDTGALEEIAPELLRAHRLLIVPGGNFVVMGKSWTPAAAAKIRDAVAQGLGYVGICAGAFLAGRSVFNGIDLTSGVRFGFYAAEDRGVRKAAVPIAGPGAPPMDQYWEDGPQLAGWGSVVAAYPDGTPAIVQGRSGRGWVVLSGVHPEAPESWRRGLTFRTSAIVDHAYAATLIRAALDGTPLTHQGGAPPAAATAAPPAIADIVAPAGGAVGFAALDLASGRTLAWHEREWFPTQSVFKLPVAIEVLHQIDDGKLELARVIVLGAADARGGPPGTMSVPAKKTVRELLEAMVIASDNVACDKLLSLVGGPRVVDARVRALGVDGVTIRFSERDLGAGRGDNTASPVAMVALLAKIARRETGLSAASAALLDDILLRVTTGPHRIKGDLPPGTPVAHKTGTSDTRDGKTDATNDVGLVTLPNGNRVVVAVFVHASPADVVTRERTIARLARVAYDTFNLRPGAAAPQPARARD